MVVMPPRAGVLNCFVAGSRIPKHALTQMSLIVLMLSVAIHQPARAGQGAAQESPSNASKREKKRGRALLLEQAKILRPLVTQSVSISFLDAVGQLPPIAAREVLINKENSRDAVLAAEFDALDEEDRKKYRPRRLDEHYYYFTRYGSPLAFVRALEVAGAQGFDTVDGARIVDFGFGSIGQLRILASRGADVTGIEVHRVLRALYSKQSDTGAIARAGDDVKHTGSLNLLFGSFPTELADSVPAKVDLFVSKNTLKRGYIHPEREVDARMLVHLGCDDDAFVAAVHSKLKPGGRFLIYNLHPAAAKQGEPYIPWADGRSPFDLGTFDRAGFDVVAFDADDSAAVRQIGAALGWDEHMDLESDLFATYTLVQKRAEN